MGAKREKARITSSIFLSSIQTVPEEITGNWHYRNIREGRGEQRRAGEGRGGQGRAGEGRGEKARGGERTYMLDQTRQPPSALKCQLLLAQ